MIRGNCDQQISRWYYNRTDQYCHSYQYTGCRKFLFKKNNFIFDFFCLLDGNANSFESEQDCQEICQAKEQGLLQKKTKKNFFLSYKNN